MPLFPVFIIAALAQIPGDDLPAVYRHAPPAPSTVVARINGHEIHASDVEPLLWEWRGFDAIQDLVTYEVVKEEAQKMALDVSQKEVEDAMAAYLKQLPANLPPGKSVPVALVEAGSAPSRLYLRFRTNLLLDKIVERSFNPQELVKVSHIAIIPRSEQGSDVAAAITKAQTVYDRLVKGEKWEAVLKESVTDPRLTAGNGLLGWRDLAIFPKSVATELLNLQPGGYTHPAQVEGAIQIFRLEVAGKTVKPDQYAEMKQAYMSASRAPLIEKLRKENRIERLFPNIPGINTQNNGN